MGIDACVKNIYSLRPHNSDLIYNRALRTGGLDPEQLPDLLDNSYDELTFRYPFAMKNLEPRDLIVDLDITDARRRVRIVRALVDRVFEDGTAYVLPVDHLNELPVTQYPHTVRDKLLFITSVQASNYGLARMQTIAAVDQQKRRSVIRNVLPKFSD